MEGTIFAAQEQALSTNVIKANIYKMLCSTKCRLCGIMDETIDHLMSSCLYLAQREYKRRHDCVASLVHYTLPKQSRFTVPEVWWRYSPPRVCENSECKLLWDFSDVSLQHNHPDVTFVLKQSNEVFLIDFAIPGDSHLSQKCTEKHTKYVDLKIEGGSCSYNCWIVGSIPVSLSTYLEKLNLPSSLIITTFQNQCYIR